MARRNEKAAEEADCGTDPCTDADPTTNRDLAAVCKDDDDKLNDGVTDITNFRTDGDTACYKGKLTCAYGNPSWCRWNSCNSRCYYY